MGISEELAHVTVEGPFLNKASIIEPSLRSLPEWFGSEASNGDDLGKFNRCIIKLVILIQF